MKPVEDIERATVALYQIKRSKPSEYPADPLSFYRTLLYQCGVSEQYTTYSFSLKTGVWDMMGGNIKARLVVYFDEELPDVVASLERFFTIEELPPKDVPQFAKQHPIALTPNNETLTLYRTAVMVGTTRADLQEFGDCSNII